MESNDTLTQGDIDAAKAALVVAYGMVNMGQHKVERVCHRYKLDYPLDLTTWFADIKTWINEARERLTLKAV